MLIKNNPSDYIVKFAVTRKKYFIIIKHSELELKLSCAKNVVKECK